MHFTYEKLGKYSYSASQWPWGLSSAIKAILMTLHKKTTLEMSTGVGLQSEVLFNKELLFKLGCVFLRQNAETEPSPG